MIDQLQLNEAKETSESDFKMIIEQSRMLVKTGFLPKAIDTPEKAVAIILTGRELGIPTMCALRSIDVIQGKPTVSPQLMMALINRSKELENIEIKEETKNGIVEAVSVTMKRKGRSSHSERFSRENAQKLGFLNKDNWQKQPAVMMKWRAVAACSRMVFPDVILGLYLPDEMEMGQADNPVVHEIRQAVHDPKYTERPHIEQTQSSKLPPVEASDYPTDMFPPFDENPVAVSLSEMLSAKQRGMIKALCSNQDPPLKSDEVCEDQLNCKTDELTKRAASWVIQYLQQGPIINTKKAETKPEPVAPPKDFGDAEIVEEGETVEQVLDEIETIFAGKFGDDQEARKDYLKGRVLTLMPIEKLIDFRDTLFAL